MTIFRFSVLLAVLLPGVAGAEISLPVALPSGQSATLIEVIWEPQPAPAGLWARFRFLAPGIAGAGLSFEAAGADMLALCREQALPAIATDGRKVDQIVVSLSAEAIGFGEADPDVLQYFEAFRLVAGDCILEGF